MNKHVAGPRISIGATANVAGLSSIDGAEALARQILAADLPQRWRHVQAVAERAAVFRCALCPVDADLLIAAAFLHDVGYAPSVKKTGFHPLDGAVHLRSLGVDERIVGLVAHHSCSCIEARFHQLDARLLREFPRDDTLPHDALLFCDLTTGPTGQAMSIDERLVDIRHRYAPDTIVARFIGEAEPEIRAVVSRMEALLAPALTPA